MSQPFLLAQLRRTQEQWLCKQQAVLAWAKDASRRDQGLGG